MTSIGFGGNEVLEVDLSLEEVRRLLQEALATRTLVEFRARNGDVMVVNPEQVKVLQETGGRMSEPNSTHLGRAETPPTPQPVPGPTQPAPPPAPGS